MASTVEQTSEASTAPPGRRWLPWQRGAPAEQAIERAGNVPEQASGTTSGLTGQMSQTSSDLLERASEGTAGLAQRAGAQTMPTARDLPRRAAFQAGRLVERFSAGAVPAGSLSASLSGGAPGAGPSAAGQLPGIAQGAAALSAERAAQAAEVAAEAAAEAAQRTAGLVEGFGGLAGLLTNRAGQQEPGEPAGESALPYSGSAKDSGQAAGARLVAGAGPAEASATGKVTDALKRATLAVGERLNYWSDGQYGLEPEKPDKKTEKALKKADKQHERLAKEAAKAAEGKSGARWIPWVIGLSLGLLVGLVGVAYWQRQRLQQLWGETSQRMQQATENVRQRIESNRSAFPRTVPPEGAPPANITPLGSVTPAPDVEQQMDGRLESASPEGRQPLA